MVIAFAARYYSLTFHRSHRDLITGSYIKHVLEKGQATATNNRQRKLFTNNPGSDWHYYRATKWSHVTFKHPSTFDTLAMEPSKKREIMNDLLKFWRGKSTMSGSARCGSVATSSMARQGLASQQ